MDNQSPYLYNSYWYSHLLFFLSGDMDECLIVRDHPANTPEGYYAELSCNESQEQEGEIPTLPYSHTLKVLECVANPKVSQKAPQKQSPRTNPIMRGSAALYPRCPP